MKTPMNEDKPFAKIHAEAKRRLGDIWAREQDQREQCREDRRFAVIAGATWEGAIGDQFKNKPKFEINHVGKSVKRIMTDYRNNPITADFVSTDGIDSDELASVLDGLYRSDEQDSDADEAYDAAFDEAVTGGFGAYRFTSDYEDEEDPDNENIRILIEPIFDADMSVFFDPNAKKQSKKSAMYAFHLSRYTREAFMSEFDEDPTSWGKMSFEQDRYDWCVDNSIVVAEYFRIEKTPVKYSWYALASEVDEEDVNETRFKDDELDVGKLAELAAMAMVRTRGRTVQERCVKKYLLSGNSVLGEPDVIAGNHIPIVPVYGQRWYIDGIERIAGHVRYAKDAQRLNNMEMSKMAEISASSGVPKPIFTPEQIAGHEGEWENDAVENYAYMLLNPISDANGNIQPANALGFTKSPEIPTATAKLYELTQNALDGILGNQDGAEEIRSNVSKEVVEQIHARLDMQGFMYISNNSKARKRGGEIWLSMARDIYVEDGRKLKTVDEEGEASFVEVNRAVQREDKTIGREADIKNAKFNVHTKVAPASSSRKAATVRTCTNMMAVVKDPEGQSVLSLTAMMNMEGEGVSGMQAYARKKLIGMGVVEPTKEEQMELAKEAEAAQGKPDPQAEYLASEARKNDAQAQTAHAQMLKATADKEKAEAQTLAILAQIPADQHKLGLETLKALSDSDKQAAPSPAK